MFSNAINKYAEINFDILCTLHVDSKQAMQSVSKLRAQFFYFLDAFQPT